MLMSELIQHVRSLVLRPDLADLLAMRTVQAVRALHQYAEYRVRCGRSYSSEC